MSTIMHDLRYVESVVAVGYRFPGKTFPAILPCVAIWCKPKIKVPRLETGALGTPRPASSRLCRAGERTLGVKKEV